MSMKVVILAGGFGTRLAEDTAVKPKPMVEIGGKRIQAYLKDQPFLMTYGDGVADINIAQLVAYHQAHQKLVTVTATQPAGRFGALTMDEGNKVKSFMEKPTGDGGWINGGFFVMQPGVFR